ncbi:MAG TPA: GNAT family acetyltransferase [Lachnospiraceae bacterium]|nr:GNAT family acetyltransferase [Lachnospiraceae bacterium]
MQSYNLRDRLSVTKRYTGSFKGMRFLIRPIGDSKEDARFEACVFPEPFNYEHTAEEKKTYEEFPYSEEGLDQIHRWLNKMYEERQEEWNDALDRGLMADG